MAATLGKLLGEPLQTRHVSHSRIEASQLQALCIEPLVAAVVERDTGGPSERLVLECAPSAAALIVDLALGGDGSLELAQGLSALDDVSCGVLAYVAARLLANSGTSYTLRALIQDRGELMAAIGGGEVHVAAVTLELGSRQMTLRVLSRRPISEARAPHGETATDPALRELPVDLHAVCGRAALPKDDVATLEVDDVVVLDECSLSDEAGPFQGNVWLCTVHGHRVLSARACDRQLVVDGRASVDTALAPPLTGEGAVELSVELACFTLTVGTVAALVPGTVLDVGRSVAELLTLRTPERAVAEGQLVHVEGELGVRVTRLFT